MGNFACLRYTSKKVAQNSQAAVQKARHLSILRFILRNLLKALLRTLEREKDTEVSTNGESLPATVGLYSLASVAITNWVAYTTEMHSLTVLEAGH